LQAMAHQHPQTVVVRPYLEFTTLAIIKLLRLGQLITCIENALGKKATKIYLPMQDGDVVRTYAVVNALETAIDFKPKTDLQVGIKQFVDWFKSYN
jgi:UDP-glucuronate 4-epimerase